jgi:hypothetical protein
MTAVIVVEGETERALIERVVDRAGITDAAVRVAGGCHAVFSFARSVMLAKRCPVAIIADSDAPPGHGGDPFSDFDFLMKRAAGPTPYRIFRFDPSLAAVFFEAPDVLERRTGRLPTDAQRWEAQIDPAGVLRRGFGLSVDDLVASLTGREVGRLIDETALGDLVAFLRRPDQRLSA